MWQNRKKKTQNGLSVGDSCIPHSEQFKPSLLFFKVVQSSNFPFHFPGMWVWPKVDLTRVEQDFVFDLPR